jgi:dihydroneopterin aldolase
MLGTVGFKDLRIKCVIGVHPHERNAEQEISLDVSVVADLHRCIESDHVHDAIDYEVLAKLCNHEAQVRQYNLLEAYGWNLLGKILERFPIQSATVTIHKKRAIVGADEAYVTLTRSKGG